ncbi:MAG: transcription termination/antitermination protein NusG, partial [Actinomycetota bacterium]
MEHDERVQATVVESEDAAGDAQTAGLEVEEVEEALEPARVLPVEAMPEETAPPGEAQEEEEEMAEEVSEPAAVMPAEETEAEVVPAPAERWQEVAEELSDRLPGLKDPAAAEQTIPEVPVASEALGDLETPAPPPEPSPDGTMAEETVMAAEMEPEQIGPEQVAGIEALPGLEANGRPMESPGDLRIAEASAVELTALPEPPQIEPEPEGEPAATESNAAAPVADGLKEEAVPELDWSSPQPASEAQAEAEAAVDRRLEAEDELEPDFEAEEEYGDEYVPAAERPGDWYVVHTYAGYENKVKANLMSRISSMNVEEKIFEVVIPMEDVMEIKQGRKQVVQKKVFPGYLLVRMYLEDDSWYVVRNTPGVTGFVGSGAKPTPLSDREINRILQVKPEDKKKLKPRLEFEEQESVRVISGPFANFTGTISEINVDQSK